MEPARKFKIIVNSKECGTCSGATPSSVAKKVVKKLCGTSSKAVRFSLKECKRGCERVCGPYQGRMEKLDRPYKRGGKTITHRVVCGKVRKMRGGRDLRIQDFEKREGDGEFRIDRRIGLEPHIFFGSTNYLRKDAYNYVIFCEKGSGGNVLIRDNNFPLYTYKLKDKYFINLLRELRKYLDNFNGFRRIKDYLNTIIPVNSHPANVIESSSAHVNVIENGSANVNVIENGSANVNVIESSSAQGNVRENDPAQGNRNGPAQVSKPIILSNCCIEYPANYQFSGKNHKGKPYNTNKLFRGTGNNHLYLYEPKKKKYELLLTELDYLVNVNDPLSITYSGVFKRQYQNIRAGSKKIPITDIDHYLYCPNESCFLKIYHRIPNQIYIQVIRKTTNRSNEVPQFSNVDINDSMQFPCWIIFKN